MDLTDEIDSEYEICKAALDNLSRLNSMAFLLPTGSSSQLAFENSFPVMRAIKRQAAETIAELMRDMGNDILMSQNSDARILGKNVNSAGCYFRPEANPLDNELLIDINDRILAVADDYLETKDTKETANENLLSEIPKTLITTLDLDESNSWVIRSKAKGNASKSIKKSLGKTTTTTEEKASSSSSHSYILKTPSEENVPLKPQQPRYREIQGTEMKSSTANELNGNEQQEQHPFVNQLLAFQPSTELLQGPHISPASFQEIAKNPQNYKILEENLIEVVDSEGMIKMIKHLSKQKEIAVDLEHHAYHSFLGYTCLIQISSRTRDYIVDPLPMNKSDIYRLHSIFINENIVKVFHGCQNDLMWLQRDFDLFIINLFDTFLAAKRLHYPRLSYQFLLDKFWSLDINKRFQLADWRLRPLPKAYKFYASADTHYLLHIYDGLRLALGDEQERFEVWQDSRSLCMKLYERPQFNDKLYGALCHNWPILVANSVQRMAFKNIYAWRWRTAEARDESLQAVLPDDMMKRIAQELPREHTGLIACCNPPPLLLKNNHDYRKELLNIIAEAVALASEEENMNELQKGSVNKSQGLKYAHPRDTYRAELVLDILKQEECENLIENDDQQQFSRPVPLWKQSEKIKVSKSSKAKAAAAAAQQSKKKMAGNDLLYKECLHFITLYKWAESQPLVEDSAVPVEQN